MGQLALVRDEVFRRHALGAALELAGLRIQALQRTKLLIAPKPGFAYRGFQHADGFVVDLERHREGMAILAPVRE